MEKHMTSLYNREKRGSQLDGKQYVFTFLCLIFGHQTCFAISFLFFSFFSFKTGLPSSSSKTPGIPVGAFSHCCPILPTVWWLLLWEWFLTQSQQESQNQTGTQQEQEEHIAHLGICCTIHAGEGLSPDSFGAPLWTFTAFSLQSCQGPRTSCVCSQWSKYREKERRFLQTVHVCAFFNNTIILMRS